MSTDELEQLVAKAVSEAMAQMKNGNGRNGAPKTIYEFMWQAAQTFGIPAAAFCVLLIIGYQTIPSWINANIETQKSLTKNLDIQTGNLNALGEQLEDVAKYSRETEVFRKEVAVDHVAMSKELHEVKVNTEKGCEERKILMESLKLLCEEITKQKKPGG